jgi:NAD(P)-dependent dehydrogenase (short-subunit alcohol dehydrogenase family)
MMLKHKVAVIYGAGGAIGGAVARAFAREGARLFLTGRHRAAVEAVASEIVSAGGSAEAAEVDALDENAVDTHLRSMIGKAGRVDISFNAIGVPDATILGVPLAELDAERFSLPIIAYTMSYFLTARTAARHMIPNGWGVIMTVTALPARGAHSRPVMRARASGHSRRRSAATRHPGDQHDEGSLRHQGQGIGHDLGSVHRVPRRHDSPATGHDARRGGERGGVHGVRQRERDDGNDRQPDDGQRG